MTRLSNLEAELEMLTSDLFDSEQLIKTLPKRIWDLEEDVDRLEKKAKSYEQQR